MAIVYPLVCLPPWFYYPPLVYVFPPYRAYLCPYCGYPLIWLPSNQWYCPYHGIISKWRFRFP